MSKQLGSVSTVANTTAFDMTCTAYPGLNALRAGWRSASVDLTLGTVDPALAVVLIVDHDLVGPAAGKFESVALLHRPAWCVVPISMSFAVGSRWLGGACCKIGRHNASLS